MDGSELDEFKHRYGTTVCGFARIWGMPVGILANNAPSIHCCCGLELCANAAFRLQLSPASWWDENTA